MEFKARKQRWIRITGRGTKQVDSEILFGLVGSGGKRQHFLTFLWKKGVNPDVLKGKPGMHWNRARPHHRGEIQLGINLDFLRKFRKSIAESWESVVGKRNSALPEFILLFPPAFPSPGLGRGSWPRFKPGLEYL